MCSASGGPPAHSLTRIDSQGQPLPPTGGGQYEGDIARKLPNSRISTGGVFRTPEMRIPKKKFSFSRSPPVRTVTSVCTYVLAPPASVHVPSVPSPNAPPITIYHRIHVKKGPHPSIPTPKGRGQGWRQIGFKERSCRATLSTQSYCAQ